MSGGADQGIVWPRKGFPNLAGGGAAGDARPDFERYGARLARDVGLEWVPGAALSVLELPSDLLRDPTALTVHLFEPPYFLPETPDADPSRTPPQASRLHARILYAVGGSGSMRIDCDWSGSVPLIAHKMLQVAVVADWARDNVSGPSAGRIDVAAALVLGERPPVAPPTYTYPSTRLIADTGEASFIVPAFARRLRAQFLYGTAPGSLADAPLGQYFFAFRDVSHGELSWIDAASAREALFGPGVWIPPGTHKVVISNRSPDLIRVSPSFVLEL